MLAHAILKRKPMFVWIYRFYKVDSMAWENVQNDEDKAHTQDTTTQ